MRKGHWGLLRATPFIEVPYDSIAPNKTHRADPPRMYCPIVGNFARNGENVIHADTAALVSESINIGNSITTDAKLIYDEISVF